VFQLRKQPQLVRQGEARQVDRHGRGAVGRLLPTAKSTAFFYRVLFFISRSGRSVFRRRRRLLFLNLGVGGKGAVLSSCGVRVDVEILNF
jgi:hypothetical protein